MDVVLRATAMFAVVYVLLRLLGKRELGQMTPFDFVTIVVMGDLIQQGITHNDFSLTGATLAISTFAFWSLVLGWAGYLFPPARRVLEGEPKLVARDGAFLDAALKHDRLTRAEVESEMRLAGHRADRGRGVRRARAGRQDQLREEIGRRRCRQERYRQAGLSASPRGGASSPSYPPATAGGASLSERETYLC